MEGLWQGSVGPLGAESPAAGGHWGSEGNDHSRQKQEDLEAEPPVLGNFGFLHTFANPLEITLNQHALAFASLQIILSYNG